ncbi:MAG: COR domain-containing protein, partial [Candidatus Cloacimonetes bacterium]|nr:COR domain-containing protein [Candidatus Cloacimonadota bacterium]
LFFFRQGLQMELNEIKYLILKAKESNATTLDLSSKGLTSLPPEIAQLKNLTTLYISFNQLSSLPPEIAQLKNLTTLYIYNNQLSSLPPEIAQLKNLTRLDISSNQLSSLPPEIKELKNLTTLDIYNNQLSSLPPEIKELKNLTTLDISYNQLSSLPTEIAQLKNLTELYISYNQLSSLPPEILELGIDIKGEYQFGEKGIFLEENPLENPPIEIVKKGREAIRNYFKSLEEEKRPLNEVKVLLVGDGGSGKTSLVKRLLGEGFDGNEHETQGINIKGWKFKDRDKEIKVNFWDFGGQEIMHATHQIFLSKRSLYILVLDSRRDEKAEYWLKHIRSFGGDSPVLVALNKIDENPSFELNRKFLQEKYPSIKGFLRVSCKDNRGIEVFSNKLKRELAKVEHLQIEWAKSWFNVKTRLEQMNCDFITYEEYRNMCLEEKVDDKSSQNTLVDFLNDLGVIVHFKDLSLLDTHVLEPKWITEGVYKIINSEILVKRKGVLRFSLLDDILEQEKEDDYYYPPTRYDYIINLMKKFELCYAIDNDTVLLPDLLAVPEPNFDFDFDSNEALKFFIEYDFLPRSIMPRFIVKMHRDIKDDLQWRTGVFLENKQFNSCAVIRSDNEAKRIYINVNGGQKRDYFSSILFNLREINRSFEKLKAIEKIPLPDEPEIAVSYDHLVYLEEIGEGRYIPEGSKKAYNVKDLLGTVNIKRTEQELLEKIFQNTELSKNREKEIIEILKNLEEIDTGSDDEDTLIEKISSVVSVNLPIPGVGLDLGKIVKLYLGWKRNRS